MNNEFLIPANSKKSVLIFGIFTKFDAILFGSGVGLSLLMMMIIPSSVGIIGMIITILPALVTGFLVFPVPNYHNVRILLISIWEFFTTRQKFIWKGWCVASEIEKETREK